ncbi:hypothetical protein ACCO45_011534 [Purpureocillium lilacinum]|uniref:Uncharacterized protein n=1 Tax=Purpureocillium lilacinum TaxID=33203 RepID=A0ACC4DBS6_PURLI
MRFSFLTLIAAAASASPIQPTVGEDAGKDLAGRSPQSQDGVPIVPLPGGSSAPKASSPQPSGQNSTQKKPPPSPATVPNKPPPPEARGRRGTPASSGDTECQRHRLLAHARQHCQGAAQLP